MSMTQKFSPILKLCALKGIKRFKRWKNLYTFLDNLLLVSKTADEHLKLLETVLLRFKEHNLKLNAEKSEFAVSEIPF